MLKQYAADFGDKAPTVSISRGGWRGALANYGTQVFECRSVESASKSRNDYFFNAHLSQQNLSRVRDAKSVVAFGDGPENGGANSHFSQWPFAQKEGEGFWTRHLGGANYAFADGHVKWLRPEVARRDFRFGVEGKRGGVK